MPIDMSCIPAREKKPRGRPWWKSMKPGLWRVPEMMRLPAIQKLRDFQFLIRISRTAQAGGVWTESGLDSVVSDFGTAFMREQSTLSNPPLPGSVENHQHSANPAIPMTDPASPGVSS
jgi:hypothetical protein